MHGPTNRGAETRGFHFDFVWNCLTVPSTRSSSFLSLMIYTWITSTTFLISWILTRHLFNVNSFWKLLLGIEKRVGFRLGRGSQYDRSSLTCLVVLCCKLKTSRSRFCADHSWVICVCVFVCLCAEIDFLSRRVIEVFVDLKSVGFWRKSRFFVFCFSVSFKPFY